MKKIVLFLLLSATAFAQADPDENALKKMIVTTTYGQYSAIYLGSQDKNAEQLTGTPRPYEAPKGFTNPQGEVERIKKELPKLTLQKENSSGYANFEFPQSLFPKSESEYKLDFIFSEILDARGNNVIEPLSEKVYDNLGINFRTSISDENEFFSIPLLNENGETPLYKAKGKLVGSLGKATQSQSFDVSQPIKFEGITIEVLKKTKEGIYLLIYGNTDEYDFSYLNNKNEVGNFSAISMPYDNPVLQYFIKENRAFTEDELEKYALTLNLGDLKKKTVTSEKTLRYVQSSIEISKIIIAKKTTFYDFELPVEVIAEGSTFLGPSVNFSEITNKDVFRDNENIDEPIGEEIDITTIKGLTIGTYDVEYSEDEYKTPLLFDALPQETTKFTGLETLNIRLSNKANWVNFINDLSKFGAFAELNSIGFNETDEEGNDVIHRIKSLPENIEKLKSLSSLNLSNHFLSKLPPTFKNLKNLTYLNLDGNAFETFPIEILSLTNLEVLDLSNNFISEIPEKICELKNLTTLRIESNRLIKIPVCLNSMEQLSEIDIAYNFLGEFFEKNKSTFENSAQLNGFNNQEAVTPLTENENYQFYKTHNP